MLSPSRLEIARHWVSERAGIIGLFIAAIFAACLALVMVPLGNGERIDGRVTGFGFAETQTGSYPVAIAQVPAGSIQVQLPRANNCALGGKLHVIRQQYLLRSMYRPAFPPC
jgi:hypothetical protein